MLDTLLKFKDIVFGVLGIGAAIAADLKTRELTGGHGIIDLMIPITSPGPVGALDVETPIIPRHTSGIRQR